MQIPREEKTKIKENFQKKKEKGMWFAEFFSGKSWRDAECEAVHQKHLNHSMCSYFYVAGFNCMRTQKCETFELTPCK